MRYLNEIENGDAVEVDVWVFAKRIKVLILSKSNIHLYI